MRKLNFSDFKDTMGLGLLRTKNQIKGHLPEIIFTVSTGLVIKGIIDSCKETPAWEDEYKGHAKNLDEIKIQYEDGDISEDTEMKETVKEHWELSKDFLKRYGRPLCELGIGFGGQICALGLSKKETRQWKSIATNLAIGTMAYRGRVADVVGADKEFDIFHNIKRKIVDEEYIDENGKKKKRKKEVIENPEEMVAGGHNSYWYGAGDAHWQGIKEFDLEFIIETEKMFNRILVGRGHGAKVTKEEVLRFMKWIDKDPWKLEANDFGWIYNEHGKYDFYVDPITGTATDLPRIIKLVGSKEFMDRNDDCDETFIDLNCYPIRGILKAQQDDIIGERLSARGGRYIATVPGIAV